MVSTCIRALRFPSDFRSLRESKPLKGAALAGPTVAAASSVRWVSFLSVCPCESRKEIVPHSLDYPKLSHCRTFAPRASSLWNHVENEGLLGVLKV